MTPSAARGLLEAVLWKPAIAWHIERIKVLNEIKFTAFRRNEVNSKAALPKKAIIESGGEPPLYFADEDRAQRNTVALADVDYVIEAHFTMTDKAGPDDNMNKFVEMFQRRVEKGQHFHQPYLGCREFAAEILPADGAPAPSMEPLDLGLMLWDIRFGVQGNTPVFFPARLKDSVLEVPASPEDVTSGDSSQGGGA
jgi:CRISPR-associated protein Cas5d